MLGLSTAVIKDMSDPGLHTLIFSLKKGHLECFHNTVAKSFKTTFCIMWYGV